MTKSVFLSALERRFLGLPKADREDRLSFYSEMIDDRVEEGLSEEEAIAAIGSVDAVVSRTIAEIPLGHLVREKMSTRRKLRGWEIALIAIGSPLWLALIITLFAAVLTVFISLWSVVLSLWAVDLALALSAVGGVGLGVLQLFFASGASFAVCLGASLATGGLSVFFFYGAKYATVGMTRLTRLCMLAIKKLFI